MKKLFTFFVLCLSFTMGFAQKTFKSYGFQSQLLQGRKGQYTYYIRILPDQQAEKSTLILDFQASKILNTSRSFLHVMVNDLPVISSHFQTDSLNRIVIPVRTTAGASSGFLKITVISQLFIGEESCQEENNPGLWINIMPSSTIYWAKNRNYDQSSVNLSNTMFSKKAIIYPNNISAAELQSVALIYAKLMKSGSAPISLYPISQMPAAIKDVIVVGLSHKLRDKFGSRLNIATKQGQGLIMLHKEADTGTVGSFSQMLFVTSGDVAGLAKATDALLTPGIMSSTFQDVLKIDQSGYSVFKKTSRIKLSDLEEGNNLMTGTGSLNHYYRFKTSAFNALPAALNCQFEIRFSDMQHNDRGYFNLYLNDILLTSRRLNESGMLQVNAVVNRYQIKKFNILRTEFVFYPANGLCHDDFQHFKGQVDVTKSYLELSENLEQKQPSFYSYPDVFQQHTAILVSKKMLSFSVRAICELVNQLNDHYSNEITYRPAVDFSDNAAKYKGQNLILISDREDPLLEGFKAMPLRYKNSFTIFGENPRAAIYRLSTTQASAISQIFSDEAYPLVLSITAPGNFAASGLLEKNIVGLNEQLNLLSGNTLINSGEDHLVFDLEKNSNNVVYQTDGNSRFQAIWSKYKLLLLAGALLLIFLAYFYVRSKVKRSQDIITQ